MFKVKISPPKNPIYKNNDSEIFQSLIKFKIEYFKACIGFLGRYTISPNQNNIMYVKNIPNIIAIILNFRNMK
jgi:hypothetical protein